MRLEQDGMGRTHYWGIMNMSLNPSPRSFLILKSTFLRYLCVVLGKIANKVEFLAQGASREGSGKAAESYHPLKQGGLLWWDIQCAVQAQLGVSELNIR